MRQACIGLTFALLLAGCGAQATPLAGTVAPTMTPRPTFTPTALPTSTPTPTVTPTPLPPTATPTPTVLPTATPAVTPTVTPQAHVVQSGETLSGIAEAYGVTVDELMKANSLQSRSLISVGQELVIPTPAGSATPSA